MPDFWEAIVLVGTAGLVAYTALTRAPGPGVIALLVLVMFVTSVGYQVTYDFEGNENRRDATLVGWPLVLLVLGGLVLAYGLSRRRGDDDGHPHRPPPEDPTDVTREVRL